SRRMGIAKFSISSIYILLFAAFFVLNMAVPVYGQYDVETLHVEKPRIIILTDITNEPDAQQSLVRLLVYSNEFDEEGLSDIISTYLKNEARPDFIQKLVEAYGQVRKKVLERAQGYPTESYLLKRTKAHLLVDGRAGVGEGKSASGSQLIIDAVDQEDGR